jgi:hypothetical protein
MDAIRNFSHNIIVESATKYFRDHIGIVTFTAAEQEPLLVKGAAVDVQVENNNTAAAEARTIRQSCCRTRPSKLTLNIKVNTTAKRCKRPRKVAM